MSDTRPANCRFRLRSEGKPYSQLACKSCGRNLTRPEDGPSCWRGDRPKTETEAVDEARQWLYSDDGNHWGVHEKRMDMLNTHIDNLRAALDAAEAEKRAAMAAAVVEAARRARYYERIIPRSDRAARARLGEGQE